MKLHYIGAFYKNNRLILILNNKLQIEENIKLNNNL